MRCELMGVGMGAHDVTCKCGLLAKVINLG
jgi:hypothetical protein